MSDMTCPQCESNFICDILHGDNPQGLELNVCEECECEFYTIKSEDERGK